MIDCTPVSLLVAWQAHFLSSIFLSFLLSSLVSAVCRAGFFRFFGGFYLFQEVETQRALRTQRILISPRSLRFKSSYFLAGTFMDPLEILKELVAIPSVNPMGRDIAGPEYLETRLSEHLIAFFRSLGVDCQKIEVLPGRANVIARRDRPGTATTVLLDAPQDSVPVEGMTIEPFEAAVRDGKLYGRGACDVKGGMAAMLAAFARLATERPAGRANVIMSCTCDEESTALGAKALAKSWSGPAQPGSL